MQIFFTVLFFLSVILPLKDLRGVEHGKSPQIIFLNGPSNSGKTTLAKALQDRLEIPFLYLSLDQIIGIMPAKINQWIDSPTLLGFGSKYGIDKDGYPISEIKIGSFAAKMRKSFIDICSTLAETGHCIIIDDVFFQNQDIKLWEKGLARMNVLWVRLRCPLHVLEEREKNRGSPKGCARYQYFHAFQKNIYDIDIDTSCLTLEQSVDIILNFFIKPESSSSK